MKPESIIVLENQLGQVVRTFVWNESQIHMALNLNTGRLEPHAHWNEKADNKHLQLVEKISVRSLTQDGPQSIKDWGSIRLADPQHLTLSPSSEITVEEENTLKQSLKWTAGVYFSLLFLIFTSSWVWNKWFQPEEVIVKVTPQYEALKQEKSKRPTITLKASNKKVKKIKRVRSHVVRKKKVRARVVSHKKSRAKTNQQSKVISKSKNLNSYGALSALGGSQKGHKRGQGLNLQQARVGQAGAGNGSGQSGYGKHLNGLKGAGLLAQTGGTNRKIKSGSGYGTKGRAGGQAGYGQLDGIGGSSSYYSPLQAAMQVQGGLSKSEIAAVIQRNKGQIQYCYEKGLQQKEDLSGRVNVYFIIDPKGRVSLANVKKSSLNSSRVEQCMLAKLRGWKFPKPQGAVNVKVTYPFILERKGQEYSSRSQKKGHG